jgi:hypothetical protein
MSFLAQFAVQRIIKKKKEKRKKGGKKKGNNKSRWNSNCSLTDNENFCICSDAFSGVCPVVNGSFSVVNRFVYNIT